MRWMILQLLFCVLPAVAGTSPTSVPELTPAWTSECDRCKQASQSQKVFDSCILSMGGATEVAIGICVTNRAVKENRCLIENNCIDPFPRRGVE